VGTTLNIMTLKEKFGIADVTTCFQLTFHDTYDYDYLTLDAGLRSWESVLREPERANLPERHYHIQRPS
jgi:hypothetical protein